MLHCLLRRRPVWMRLADTVIRIFSVPATWAFSYTVTCVKDNDMTAWPSESDSRPSMVLQFSRRQQNFNNQVLQLWEDWEINLMCLDTCLATANVIFLLRTHQLPWALERKWLFCYAWNGAQDIGWKEREVMVKQTSVCGYVESLANGRWLWTGKSFYRCSFYSNLKSLLYLLVFLACLTQRLMISEAKDLV